MTTGVEETVAIIVGAGPSGLATAACLHQLSIPYIILEREDCIASLFNKKTYNRLHLHLVKKLCQLPHLPFPKSFPTYVPIAKFLKYLDDYATHFNINPRFCNLVKCAKYDEDVKRWKVETEVEGGGVGLYEGMFMVVATGETSDVFIPEVDGLSEFKGEVIHSTQYKSGKGYENKNVLVVGSGNSGMEIALDLSNYGANTSIVVRSPVVGGEMVTATRSSKRLRLTVSVCDEAEDTPGPSTRAAPGLDIVDPIHVGSSAAPVEKTRARKREVHKAGVVDGYVPDTLSPKNQGKLIKCSQKQSWGSLKSRSSPRQLFLAISKLSARQREAVRQIGFGEMLRFSVDGIPVKLAHYAVDALQPDKMRMRCRKQEVAINADVVHKLFGIPRGGINFATLKEQKELHPTLQIWRNRYPPNSYVSTPSIVKYIHADEYDDMFIFKVDFIMLFVTTMINSYGNGLCKEEIPKCFTSETAFESIDWCDYMVTCLKTCKQKWRRNDPGCAFAGPMTFLTLLYVDSFAIDGFNTPLGVRAMHHWSLELLSQRQEYEIKHGGFGLGKLKEITMAVNVGDRGVGATIELDLRAARNRLSELEVLKTEVGMMLSSLFSRYPGNQDVIRLQGEYRRGFGVETVSDKGKAVATPTKTIKDVVEELAAEYASALPHETAGPDEGSEDNVLVADLAANDESSDSGDHGGNKATGDSGSQQAADPTLWNTVSASPDAAVKSPIVQMSGCAGGAIAGEMEAHRRRFGLATIWAAEDRNVVCTPGQPSFSLGLTQLSQAAVDNLADNTLPNSPEPPVDNRRLSAPTFSLGLTQEDLSVGVSEKASAGVCFTPPSFSLGLTQDQKNKSSEVADDLVAGDGIADVGAKVVKVAGASVEKGRAVPQDVLVKQTVEKTPCVASDVASSSQTATADAGVTLALGVTRGPSRSMVARLPVQLNSKDELDTTASRKDVLVWTFLFAKMDKTQLMEQATLEAKKHKQAAGGVVNEADIDPTEYYPYVLYQDRHGFRAEAPLLHSLAVGRRLYGNVIDAWVNILNHDPIFRTAAGGVRRLFLPVTTIVAWMLMLDKDPDGRRVAAFKNGVSAAVIGNQQHMQLQSVDLVFVPVLDCDHYYVVVFDFKNEDICVIDNIVQRKSPMILSECSLYILKSTPYKVKYIFGEYLALVNHPKAEAMSRCDIRRVPLPWATSKNTDDCGVFLMRHMENYCGASVPFRCGFSLNGKRKQAQLDTLRKRFAATILLSSTNIYAERVWRGSV